MTFCLRLSSNSAANQFRKSILNWFAHSGRHDLPWQKKTTPYNVWISEIMLQQTQVTTVIPYFNAFMKSFPSIKKLASADINTVLAHWSGLGYYARARNLYKTAQIVQQEFKGKFPNTVENLSQLPGIGRSTAGAILSLGHQLPAPILDGNVKRVLARFHALEGPPTEASVLKQLWEISELYTPKTEKAGPYNQAMMDLGATLCTRTKPKCEICPLNKDCKAHQLQQEEFYPQAKARSTRPKKSVIWLLLRNKQGELLLQQRPPTGIWGGLWSLPECLANEDLSSWCQQQFACSISRSRPQPRIKHIFSHFELDIQPVLLDVIHHQQVQETNTAIWIDNQKTKLTGGIAAPVKKLLTQLGYL